MYVYVYYIYIHIYIHMYPRRVLTESLYGDLAIISQTIISKTIEIQEPPRISPLWQGFV